MLPRSYEEAVTQLWGAFDETSAGLVLAKRRLRDGTGSNLEILELRARLAGIRADLVSLGEHPEATEPG